MVNNEYINARKIEDIVDNMCYYVEEASEFVCDSSNISSLSEWFKIRITLLETDGTV